MFAIRIIFICTIFSCPFLDAHGQVPMLSFSGRVQVGGVPFNGTGIFVFSIEETNGVTWWKSGDLPYEGSGAMPPRVVNLAVQNGAYNVLLGDPARGMPPLDFANLRRAISPHLRVWFTSGNDGWHRVGDALLADSTIGSDAKESPMTSAQAEALLTEIRQLRSLYQPTPVASAEPTAAPTATISIKGCPSLGNTNAPVVLLEFIDFECPFCKESHETSLAEIRKKYVETGKVRLVFRNLPLNFHSQAEGAARAGICAAEQDKFWPMHDRLLTTSPQLDRTNLFRAAEQLKLEVPAFAKCFDASRTAQQIKTENKDASIAGIHGTPAFILGRASGDQVTGEILAGVQTFTFLDKQIQRLIER